MWKDDRDAPNRYLYSLGSSFWQTVLDVLDKKDTIIRNYNAHRRHREGVRKKVVQ